MLLLVGSDTSTQWHGGQAPEIFIGSLWQIVVVTDWVIVLRKDPAVAASHECHKCQLYAKNCSFQRLTATRNDTKIDSLFAGSGKRSNCVAPQRPPLPPPLCLMMRQGVLSAHWLILLGSFIAQWTLL